MINLYSDTQTLPTPPMREAMAHAPVGDEQRGADPSVNALCERVADLLGQESAVFLPSGTMCNEIAIRVHCQPGDEVIADRTSHIINFEGGGPAAISGVMLQPVDGVAGIYDVEQAAAAIRYPNRYSPRTRLIAVEQTANLGGGTIWPKERIKALAALATENGLGFHMDGARLMNAAVASGEAPSTYATPCDSVWIDLSKGLGCPVGGVLAGSQSFIDDVWIWKQRFGGAMRQAGILAAAGLYALDHHVERLAVDHDNAARLAHGLADIDGIDVDLPTVQTNIVYFALRDPNRSADNMVSALNERGVVVGAMGPQRLRAVTHLDVSSEDVDTALNEVAAVMNA
ncbi:MAG: threonine aldolase family protein [Pseudomonadota bacterium]